VPVGVFSLEMSKGSLVQRMLSAFSQVDSHRMRTGHLSQAEMASLHTHAEGLAETPIFIDDTPGLSILALRARARRMVAQHGVRCVMIDYLQLLSAPGAGRESRQVEVSSISRGLKALARELKVPVICLSQLNRASEQREGNRPRMSDLRESGSIEQDADVVALLHREDYYHIQNPQWAQENPDKVNTAELIIAKQRNGPTGTVNLTWDPKTTRFRNYAGYTPPADWAATSSPFDAEPKPFHDEAPPPPAPRAGFPMSQKTGPVADFRDGGGPDPDDDLGGIPI
jgi:replicative DNA helicase